MTGTSATLTSASPGGSGDPPGGEPLEVNVLKDGHVTGGIHGVFRLDEAQRWALYSIIVLALAAAATAYVLYGLIVNATLAVNEPRVDLSWVAFLTLAQPGEMVWVQIALASLLGALLEVAWGVGYHGFWEKNFDPETIVFSVPKIIQAPIITLLAFGAAVVLPFDVTIGVPLTMATLSLAILCGYYSDDVLDAVHRGFTRILTGKAGVRVGRPLPKAYAYPLDALLDHPVVAPFQPQEAERAVAALRKEGASTSAQLAVMKEEELERVAKKHDVKLPTLLELQSFCKSLSETTSLREGVVHHRKVLVQRAKSGEHAAEVVKRASASSQP